MADELVVAIKTGDYRLIKSWLKKNENEADWQIINDVLTYSDDSQNTIFHDLLSPLPWYRNTHKRRQANAALCDFLLKKSTKIEALNQLNKKGLSPFHLAIKAKNPLLFDAMLKAGADYTLPLGTGLSTIEYAATFEKEDFYKNLLELHTQSCNDSTTFKVGFSPEAIQRATDIYKAKLSKKHIGTSLIDTIKIACPIGAIMAFSELPVLGVFLGIFIPAGVASLIGLCAAGVIGGLLFWAMYQKESFKYGDHKQAHLEIDSLNAQIEQLEHMLKNYDAAHPQVSHQQRQNDKQEYVNKLIAIYAKVKLVNKRNESDLEDWVTSKDKARMHLLTFGSFLCSFSGILGVVAGVSAFLPSMLTTTAVLIGIPVVGWAALGIALTVGIIVAVCAYRAKFKPALLASGKMHQELHQRQLSLVQRKTQFEEAIKSGNNNGIGFSGILEKFNTENGHNKNPVVAQASNNEHYGVGSATFSHPLQNTLPDSKKLQNGVKWAEANMVNENPFKEYSW